MNKPRHNFHKGIELHKICSIDEIRPVMNYIYFDGPYAVASDGHILIKAKVNEISNFDEQEIEMLNGHLLHAKNFQLLMRYPIVSIEKDGFLVRGDGFKIKINFYSGDSLKYPSYQKILDDWESGNQKKTVLNPYYLSDICASVNATSVRMRFGKRDTDAIKLEFTNVGLFETEGMIMPRLDSEDY